MNKEIIVFYHGLCRDGFTAAWAAWKKFGDEARYIPVIWSNLKEEKQLISVNGKEVYFLDYCPTRENLEPIIQEAKSVVVIDHHVSREEVVKSLPGSVYDKNHCGAVLAWQYFHPDKPVPQLCLYVEDSDLWNLKIQNSDSVLNYIDFKYSRNFTDWNRLAETMEKEQERNIFADQGKILVEYRRSVVDLIITQQGQIVDFEGYEVIAVNAPRYFRSEIGNQSAILKPPFGIVWSYTPEEISISLRGISDLDLTKLSGKYGGGGHVRAANFRLPLGSPLPWKVISPYDPNYHEK